MKIRYIIWKGLLACAMLMAMSAFAETSSSISKDQATRLIEKISAGQELTIQERSQVQDYRQQTGIDLWGYNPQNQVRDPRRTLDEYQWTSVDYEWIDITGVGTAAGITGDDQNVGPFNLGFSFTYFDQTYTSVRMCSNGWASFTSTAVTYFETAIPAVAEPNNVMYCFWDDMYPPSGGEFYYYSDTANDRFIMSWINVPHIGSTTELYTYQIVLNENGSIQYNYQLVAEGGVYGNTTCTVGLENAAGTEALQICFDGDGTLPTSETSIYLGQFDGVPAAPSNVVGTPNGTDVTITWNDPTQDTNGNPLTPDGIEIWQGAVGIGTLLATVGAGVETYTITNLQSGNYSFCLRATAGEFSSAPTCVTVIVGNPSYFSDFEADNGSLVPGDGWTWGSPAGFGPGTAHSGVNCWSTSMSANYPNSACYNLDINQELTVGSDNASLEFYMWYSTETGWDGMTIQVSVDGGTTWAIVAPTSPPYDGNVNGLTGCFEDVTAWNGLGNSWRFAIVPLGAYVGETPIIRFAFVSDPSVQGIGVFIDDVTLWGFGEPEFAPVSGTISFDGGAGVMTAVSVSANGIGSPVTNPAANGTYTFPQVLVGNRRISASLTGYHPIYQDIVLTNAGMTGVNLTLVRVDPPVPTGLVGAAENATGLVTLDWDNFPDALVDVYPVYRRLQGETDWVLQGSPAVSAFTQTLPVAGIYEYAVAARDNNVSTPVESDATAPITVLYGALPPSGLSAGGNYDDRIVLNWFEPGTPPEIEVYYDSVDVDPTCVEDGLGFNGQFPFGWFAGHYQGNGAITINRVKTRHWPNSAPGCVVQMGVFEDDGTGQPTLTPLGVTDWTVVDPATSWQDVELTTPVTVASGSFFVGIRQVTAQRVDIGMDFCAEEQPNTFFAVTAEAGPWTELGSVGFTQVLCMRAFVIGDMGTGLMELEPSPVGQLSKVVNSEDVALAASFISTNNGTATENTKTNSAKAKAVKEAAAASASAPMTFAPRPTHKFVDATSRVVTNREESELTREPGRSLDEVLYYIVYRDNVDIAHPVAETYTDLGRIENTVYHYTVLAHYDDGQNSVRDSIDARCNMAPGAPTGLVANPLGTQQMVLAWVAPTTNADATPLVDLAGYRVFRDGVQIGTTGAGVTTYTDTPPDNQTFYTWTISAVDEVPNISDPSNAAIAAIVSPWEVVDFEWVDITGNGTVIVNSDDVNSQLMPLPWDFTFYGNTFTQFSVCSNGWLSFSSISNSLGGTMPNAAEPNNTVAANWMDLNPATAGDVYMYDDVANDRMIISWVGVPQFGNPNNIYDFQIILAPPTSIYFYYQTVAATIGTVGVENGDGTDAIAVWQNSAGAFQPTNNSGIAFWAGPSGAVAGLVREFGTNLPIQNAEVWIEQLNEFALTDAAGNFSHSVEPGTYTLRAHKQGYCDVVTENVVVDDGGTTTRNFSMRQPNATFDASSLNIFATIGQDGAVALEITNPGATCEVSYSITTNQTWLTVNPASGDVAANESQLLTVSADVSAFPIGDYQAMMTIDHNDTDSPTEIPVTVTVSLDAYNNAEIPTEFALHANYPNPFNATTSLNFDVPTESRVQITIFNVQGQEVARPVDSVLPAGSHRVIYSASELSTGMYLVKMTAADFTAVQKIVLLK